MEIGQTANMVDHESGRRWEGIITEIIKDTGDFSHRGTAPKALIKEIGGNLERRVNESELWWNADKRRWYQPI